MKITDSLREEHRILSPQIDQLEKLLNADTPLPELRAFATRFARDLLSHARMEDEILFPPLEEYFGRESGPVAVMKYEHNEIEGGLADVGSLETVADLRQTLVQVLRVARQHFFKEDNMLFPMAEQILDADVLKKMNATLKERREAEPLAAR